VQRGPPRVRRSRALDGEAVAAFLAPRRQDAPAVLRRHAFEEAVDALAAPVVRLIGPLHEGVLLEGWIAGTAGGATRQYTGPPGRASRQNRVPAKRSSFVHSWGEACGRCRAETRRRPASGMGFGPESCLWESRGYARSASSVRRRTNCG
jgi:hypothetical protein